VGLRRRDRDEEVEREAEDDTLLPESGLKVTDHTLGKSFTNLKQISIDKRPLLKVVAVACRTKEYERSGQIAIE